MLRRLAIVIYSSGLLFGVPFLLSGLYSFGSAVMNGGPILVYEVGYSTTFGIFLYGIGWAFRYIVTGAKGVHPMAKGSDDSTAD